MCSVFLLLSVLCVTIRAQESRISIENQTSISVPYHEISNTIENGTEYRDSIDNIKFACSLTLEPYNETIDGDISKVHTKLRLATVCCPGYKRNHRGVCQPHCSAGCGDGYCEFPEICTCPPNCAFNTVDRKCVCFEAVCPGGCPPNRTCVADNTCDCNQGFIQSNNWTRQYTNSSLDCIPYCFPFCTNKLFTTPELCICNYTADGNESGEVGFDSHRKSHTYLGHLFQSHGHPSFASGLAGFGLGALVGGMIGSRGKSKYKYGKGGMPGNYGAGYNQGYGVPGTHYGGGGGYGNVGQNYGVPGNANYGGYGNVNHAGASHGHPGYNTGAAYPGQGTSQSGTYPRQGTTYGGTYPAQGTNYGQGMPVNTNPGTGGNYGNGGQVSGHGQPAYGTGGAYGTGQNAGSVYGAGIPGQTHTQTHAGTVGQGTASNSGWNNPSQASQGSVGNAGKGTGTNYGWNTPGQAPQGPVGNTGKSAQNSYGWSVPGPGSQDGGSNTNNGQRTNYGWSVPSSSNAGSKPAAGSGTGGKESSSGTSWWPWGSGSSGSGKGNSGGGSSGKGGSSSSGSRGRKRGKKH